MVGYIVAHLVGALRYKPEGRGSIPYGNVKKFVLT
jgi:hypothetical protein